MAGNECETAEERIDAVASFETLKLKYEELLKLDSAIFDGMLEANKAEEELDKEIASKETYLKNFTKARVMIDGLESCSGGESLSVTQKRTYKLPQLQLRKFNGNIKDWLPFWAQFKKIHEDDTLDPADKFQYLLQCMEPNTRAKELVESYPATEKNYPKAVESLKERFGQKDRLVEVYIRELLMLVMQNTNSRNAVSLSSLYDRLESHLRALDSLGVVTETYDAMLFPLVESSIPGDLLRIWQRQATDGAPKDRLKDLMKFVRQEIANEERISIATEGFDAKKLRKPIEKKHYQKNEDRISTATDLFAGKEVKVNRLCCFCEGRHNSSECFKARDMSLAQRRKILSDKRCCFNCLVPGHTGRKCKAFVRCLICRGKHTTIMCSDLSKSIAEKDEGTMTQEGVSATAEVLGQSVESLHSSSSRSPEVFLQTLAVNMKNGNINRRVRAIIDTGAQKSYILKSTAVKMGYEPIKEELFSHRLFGGEVTEACQHKSYKIYLGSLDDSYQCSLEALDQRVICGEIPTIENGSWMRELKLWNISLTDIQKTPGPIEVLIGADVAGKLFTGQRKELKNGLVAMQTKLGWTVIGKVPETQKEKISSTVTTMFVEQVNLSNLWNLEMLGIRDPVEQRSSEEKKQAILQHFEETVSQGEDGRYEAHMPWKVGHHPLPENYDLAKRRLESTTRKLNRDNLMNRYQEVFDEWLQEGVIERVPQSEISVPGHYLPHRPILKEESTTKVRPVFDASAKSPGHPSLNDCLETGINLIESIPTVLTKFRSKKIGVISDIKKAFLQIRLVKSDRNYLRFLWHDVEGNLIVFRHNRVVFGVTCSPFLLEAVIKHHLSQEHLMCESGERNWHASNIEKLQDSFYVDNCVTSVDTEEELYNFIEEATAIMAKGQFDLRGWEYTCLDMCIPGCYESKVLGIVWNRDSDTLKISSDCLEVGDCATVTKRKMLAVVNRIYDPVGVACPFTLRPKLLLQSTWKTKETWDTEVPVSLKEDFLKWTQDLQYVGQIQIPRWFGGAEGVRISLHTFCDASKLAYAAAVFIRCETVAGVTVQLVQARSRVAPIKKVTIPRLELLAATIGARMHSSVLQNLNMDNVESYLWTDSTTVLAWIYRDDEWGVFVNNRVTEIKRLTSCEQWRHVPGIQNPADLPSRGCDGRRLLQSRWWEGPVWLHEPMEAWPSTSTDEDEQQISLERKRCVRSTLIVTSNQEKAEFYYFSHYPSIVRMFGWILRFRSNAALPKPQRAKGELSCDEYTEAEQRLLKMVQDESFNSSKDPKLSKLYPYADEKGVIRLQTKISCREDSRDFRHPIVLPNHKHPVVFRLIMNIHKNHSHAGSQMMRSILREHYWILGGCHTIRAVINQCQACKRFKAKKLEAVPNPLPEDRVREAKVFEVLGVDFAGPLYVKTGAKMSQKVWICLFTCAVYRAVHFELISSLSTDAFLQGFRRFISRRGRPSVVYCDNATNFTGASNACNRVDWDRISSYSMVRKIRWNFNPPAAPWWGGWYERLVGVLKQLLRRVLGNAVLSYEELQTILCDCEAAVNKRPLTVMTENPTDLEPITPDMFLKDIDEVGIPDLDVIESKNMDKRLRYRANLREQLLRRFRSEYLGQLKMQLPKLHSREIVLGEIVLIGSDNKKRSDWPLARVIELLPGKDGRTRLVRLKTQSGVLLRPIQRLYPLEIVDDQIVEGKLPPVKPIKHANRVEDTKPSPVKAQQGEKRLSRYGRVIKVPDRLAF